MVSAISTKQYHNSENTKWLTKIISKTKNNIVVRRVVNKIKIKAKQNKAAVGLKRQAHPVSIVPVCTAISSPFSDLVSLRLPALLTVNLASNCNSPDRSTKVRHQFPSGCLLSTRGFRFSFTLLPGSFSPFLHSTAPLSVTGVFRLGGGPPASLQGFSCPVVLWILSAEFQFRLPDFHLLWCAFPKHFNYLHSIPYTVLNPRKLCLLVWPLSFRSPLLRNRFFFLLLLLLRCFQFAAFPSVCYGFTYRYLGFLRQVPHSDIFGSMAMCASPKLFAAYHVLHRLPVPRHSPRALSCLTF